MKTTKTPVTNGKQKIEIVIEKNDGILWGIIEGKGKFAPTPYGETKDELIANLKELIADYKTHEDKKDKFWSKINVNSLDVEISYDLRAFFKEFDELKISSIAKRAKLNESLIRQYASGHKNPSAEQVKKIEDAVHKLGERLLDVAISA